MREKLTALSLLGCSVVAAQTKPPAAMPKTMQICVAVCANLEWLDNHYVVRNGNGVPSIVYEVESFTPQSILLKRTELKNNPAFGLTAEYKGSFTEGAKAAQGTVDFKWPNHPGYPHSANWKATWGDAVATYARPPRKPEERGDAEEAQAQSAQDERTRQVELGILGFFAGVLGATPPSGGGSGAIDGNASTRVAQLHSRVDELSSRCAVDLKNVTGVCDDAREAREDLAEANADLNREIDALKTQAGKLQKDCAEHVAGACQKLNQVKAKLESDIESRMSGIF